MMNLINEEAETVPVGTQLDLPAYSTAEPRITLIVIHLTLSIFGLQAPTSSPNLLAYFL